MIRGRAQDHRKQQESQNDLHDQRFYCSMVWERRSQVSNQAEECAQEECSKHCTDLLGDPIAWYIAPGKVFA